MSSMTWIDPAKRLPEPGQEVEFEYEENGYGGTIVTVRFDGTFDGDFFNHVDGVLVTQDRVTRWRPLTPLPSQSAEVEQPKPGEWVIDGRLPDHARTVLFCVGKDSYRVGNLLANAIDDERGFYFIDEHTGVMYHQNEVRAWQYIAPLPEEVTGEARGS